MTTGRINQVTFVRRLGSERTRFHGVLDPRVPLLGSLSPPSASETETPRTKIASWICLAYKKVFSEPFARRRRSVRVFPNFEEIKEKTKRTRDDDSLCGFFVLPLGASTLSFRLRFHREGGAPAQTASDRTPSRAQRRGTHPPRARDNAKGRPRQPWRRAGMPGRMEPKHHSIPGPDSLKGENEWALSEYSYSLLPSGLTRIAVGWLVRLLRLRTKLWPRENCC